MKPWDRRDDETPPAWEAFQTYRDQAAERSLVKTGQALGKNSTTIEQWSSRHEWVSRALAWDRHLDQIVQARLAKQSVDRRLRWARLGQAMGGVAGQGLQGLVGKDGKPKRDLKPNEIAQLAKAGFEIEQVAEGDASERLAVEGGGFEVRLVDVRSLPDPRLAGVIQPASAPATPAGKAPTGPPRPAGAANGHASGKGRPPAPGPGNGRNGHGATDKGRGGHK